MVVVAEVLLEVEVDTVDEGVGAAVDSVVTEVLKHPLCISPKVITQESALPIAIIRVEMSEFHGFKQTS